jgi:hypothetical protein
MSACTEQGEGALSSSHTPAAAAADGGMDDLIDSLFPLSEGMNQHFSFPTGSLQSGLVPAQRCCAKRRRIETQEPGPTNLPRDELASLYQHVAHGRSHAQPQLGRTLISETSLALRDPSLSSVSAIGAVGGVHGVGGAPPAAAREPPLKGSMSPTGSSNSYACVRTPVATTANYILTSHCAITAVR